MSESLFRVIRISVMGLAFMAALTGCSNNYSYNNPHVGWGASNGWGYNSWQRNTVVVDNNYRQNNVLIENNRYEHVNAEYYHPGRNWR